MPCAGAAEAGAAAGAVAGAGVGGRGGGAEGTNGESGGVPPEVGWGAKAANDRVGLAEGVRAAPGMGGGVPIAMGGGTGSGEGEGTGAGGGSRGAEPGKASPEIFPQSNDRPDAGGPRGSAGGASRSSFNGLASLCEGSGENDRSKDNPRGGVLLGARSCWGKKPRRGSLAAGLHLQAQPVDGGGISKFFGYRI